MQIHGNCKLCQGQLAILDILLEGYDVICSRCGHRERQVMSLAVVPVCYQ